MPILVRRKDNLKASVAEDKIGIAIRQGFEQLGDALINSLRSRSPKDRGGFQKGHRKRISGRGLKTRLLVYNSAPHAEFVELGRKPGKQSPPQAILGWVKRRNLGKASFSSKGKSAKSNRKPRTLLSVQKSIAFLISRAIGRRGIKGRYLYRDLRRDESAKISAAMTAIKINVAAQLNG